MPARMEGTIVANRSLTADIRLVQVEAPLAYIPGQFVLFDIPAGNPAPAVQRAFSMANFRKSEIGSQKSETGIVDFLVKIVPGGRASEYFRNARIGETVAFSAPIGFFTLPNPLPEQLTFVATGTGLAPFRSMLQWLAGNQADSVTLSTDPPPLSSPFTEGGGSGRRGTRSSTNIRLLFGCRTEEDMLCRDELEDFTKSIPNFSFEYCLSRANGSANGGWNGINGRVTHALDGLPHSPPGAFYLCGNQSMIVDCRKLLMSKGVEPKRIHFEIFFPV